MRVLQSTFLSVKPCNFKWTLHWFRDQYMRKTCNRDIYIKCAFQAKNIKNYFQIKIIYSKQWWLNYKTSIINECLSYSILIIWRLLRISSIPKSWSWDSEFPRHRSVLSGAIRGFPETLGHVRWVLVGRGVCPTARRRSGRVSGRPPLSSESSTGQLCSSDGKKWRAFCYLVFITLDNVSYVWKMARFPI